MPSERVGVGKKAKDQGPCVDNLAERKAFDVMGTPGGEPEKEKEVQIMSLLISPHLPPLPGFVMLPRCQDRQYSPRSQEAKHERISPRVLVR